MLRWTLDHLRFRLNRAPVLWERGLHGGVSWTGFFSEQNLRGIRQICGRGMESLGYGEGARGD